MTELETAIEHLRMTVLTARAVAVTQATVAVDELAALLAAHGVDLEPADDEETEHFEEGKFYITENNAFVFQCNEVIAGIALGRELRVDGRPSEAAHQVYLRPGTRELWREIDEKQVHATYGEHGWVHRPPTRPTAAN